MGLCLGAACKPSFWSERPGKMRVAEPSTKEGAETVRFCAFSPPGSLLDRQSVVVFPLTMNNSDYHMSQTFSSCPPVAVDNPVLVSLTSSIISNHLLAWNQAVYDSVYRRYA